MKFVWIFAIFLFYFIGGLNSTSVEKYCGGKLTRILSSMCKKVYNEPQKKSVLDIIYPNKKPHFQFDEYENGVSDDLFEDYQDYFKGSSSGSRTPSLNSIFNRNRRAGIVDECCKKPCSRDILMLYCAGE